MIMYERVRVVRVLNLNAYNLDKRLLFLMITISDLKFFMHFPKKVFII